MAEDAEEIAEILGYQDLDHYVMNLIHQDIQEKQDMVSMAHRVITEREEKNDEEE